MGALGPMTDVTVTLQTGRTVTFEVDLDLDPPAFFVLSIRKSGSTMVNEVVTAMAIATGRRSVEVGTTLFHSNVLEIDYREDPGLLDILHPGNVYGGFRLMPRIFAESQLFRASPKILFVRDPRDALVSGYFSTAFSHPIPAAGPEGNEVTEQLQRQRTRALALNIDQWVTRNAADFNMNMLEFAPFVGEPSTLLLKYEDCIFDKGTMMREIARHFDWEIDDELIGLILEWADVRPEKEDPKEFIRQVTPGDHGNKLRADTIATITKILEPGMDLFGYAASS
jgi:hypothetical protein